MKQYLNLLEKCLSQGIKSVDRTGVGTTRIFGEMLKFDLSEGFPLVTTKKTFFRGIIEELLFFISAGHNVKQLQDKNVHIWDEWAKEDGELGPIYGVQWRKWMTHDNYQIDQLKYVIGQIKTNPQSRRLIVSAWNPGEIEDMALPPCHVLFQFQVIGDKLNMLYYQRSADLFLGLPFNIASYAALLMMIVQLTNKVPGELTVFLGDCHIYNNHLPQVGELLTRKPIPLPTLTIDQQPTIDHYRYEHFHLHNYTYWPPIKGEVAV